MYSCGLARGVQVVMGDLSLWANISKEHPTFLLTVAGLSGLKIDQEAEDILAFFHDNFQRVEEKARQFAQISPVNVEASTMPEDIHFLIKEFSILNADFVTQLHGLSEIIHSGKEKNYVWKLLISHIMDEQEYIVRQLNNNINQFYY